MTGQQVADRETERASCAFLAGTVHDVSECPCSRCAFACDVDTFITRHRDASGELPAGWESLDVAR